MKFFFKWLTAGLFCLLGSVVSAQSCTGTSTRSINVEDCSASTEASRAALQVFPNPAKDVIVLKNSGEKLFFELFDSFGRKVMEMGLAESQVTTFHTSHLSTGVYLAKYCTRPGENARFLRIEILR